MGVQRGEGSFHRAPSLFNANDAFILLFGWVVFLSRRWSRAEEGRAKQAGRVLSCNQGPLAEGCPWDMFCWDKSPLVQTPEPRLLLFASQELNSTEDLLRFWRDSAGVSRTGVHLKDLTQGNPQQVSISELSCPENSRQL